MSSTDTASTVPCAHILDMFLSQPCFVSEAPIPVLYHKRVRAGPCISALSET